MADAQRRAIEKQRAKGNDPTSTRRTPEEREDHTSWLYHLGSSHQEWLANRKKMMDLSRQPSPYLDCQNTRTMKTS